MISLQNDNITIDYFNFTWIPLTQGAGVYIYYVESTPPKSTL